MGIALDLKEKDSFSLGHEIGRTLIIFGVNVSSSPYTDNNKEIF